MPEIAQYSPGTFCWVDAGTNDMEKAKAFYATVLGWAYATADDSGYTMCLKAGKPVAGLYPLSEDLLRMGAAPCWMPYAAVTDADAAMAKATGAGAQPMGPVLDVPGRGRGGAFSDPSGAMCGIWQGSGHKGAAITDEHGALSWVELQTHDPAAAACFYSTVFGWEQETAPRPDGLYYLFRDGEVNRGGMMAITPAMAEVPPNWSVYFHVDDADAAVAAAQKAGGQVVVPVLEVGGVGRMAVLRSADGAHFSILEPAPMP
jgi:predicted enzyme related to lactoylglutathione lyase